MADLNLRKIVFHEKGKQDSFLTLMMVECIATETSVRSLFYQLRFQTKIFILVASDPHWNISDHCQTGILFLLDFALNVAEQ